MQNPVSTSTSSVPALVRRNLALFWQALSRLAPSWPRPRPLRLLSQRAPNPFRALGLQTTPPPSYSELLQLIRDGKVKEAGPYPPTNGEVAGGC